MNPQPFQTPPRRWSSQLNPVFVQLYTPRRNRDLRMQRIDEIVVRGAEQVSAAIAAGCGVLVVSNHSFHYDSFVMIEAARRSSWFPHIMTAWQVFQMYPRWGQKVLQLHGCFSVNREANDTTAFRQALSVLESGSHPLLIYPEGDIYHSNDKVMPFREGAAALALLAHKKKSRRIVVVPAAMKCFYTGDPSAELRAVMDRLETHLTWRPAADRSLVDRIYRFGNGFLALKETEYLGQPRTGTVRERLAYLANAILTQIRERHGMAPREHDLADRIRMMRMHLIRHIEQLQKAPRAARRDPQHAAQLRLLQIDMQDLFFVTQLSSYHGDYSASQPTIERLAETIDKFEEDVFGLQAPTPRGRRRAEVNFGTPLSLESAPATSRELTLLLEEQVQSLLNRAASRSPPDSEQDKSPATFSAREAATEIEQPTQTA